MRYTVQLIHQSGHIDTVEQAIYNPYSHVWIKPLTVHIANAGIADDTVMLRVLGDFSGVPDDDSLVGFALETMLDKYPTMGDSTIAVGTGGTIIPPPAACFQTMGPFPNPSTHGATDVSILVHYCTLGSSISAQVYDYLGTPIGSASTSTSDGQVWDRLPINSPTVAGTYYIVISVGGYSSTVGYTVY